MSMTWNEAGKRFYERGLRNGVLYLKNRNRSYQNGIPWNGLISVTESPSGAEPNPVYGDDTKYLNLISKEEFSASIKAYTYPEEFTECIGLKNVARATKASQQHRRAFGLCYRTVLGNDTLADSYGYKLHIIFEALAGATEIKWNTMSESPEPVTFSWEITTTPADIGGMYRSSHLIIDSTKADPVKLGMLEEIIYGNELAPSRMPTPAEVLSLMGEYVPPEDPEDPNTYISGTFPLLDILEF